MEYLILLIEVFIVFNIIMGLASLCTWFERKVSALIQDRIGANRAGAYLDLEFEHPVARVSVTILRVTGVLWLLRWLGILGVVNTLVCDGVKALLKEDFIPEGTSNFMHCLAPFLAVFPVFLAYAIIPLAPEFSLAGYNIRPQIADGFNAGLLFFLAMGSVAVYGVAFAGWTSNNKFALLGALRAAAQMISYELAMGISIVSVVVVYGSLDLYEIVQAQSNFFDWGIIKQFPAFIIFFIAGMAETKRGPFDLPESESELVAGYFTEYSGMKFLLFWLGEFAEIALFSLVIVLLFFGGWHLPGLQLEQGTWLAALVGHGIFMAKVIFFCLVQIILRWTLPRFRYDQLMNLGWKGLLPLSLVWLLVVATFKLGGIWF